MSDEVKKIKIYVSPGGAKVACTTSNIEVKSLDEIKKDEQQDLLKKRGG